MDRSRRMSERRRDGKVKGEKWKVESGKWKVKGGGLTRWGIDRISPLPERFLTGVIFIFVGTFPKVPFVSAVRRGLEPLTPCVTGTYSNQLN